MSLSRGAKLVVCTWLGFRSNSDKRIGACVQVNCQLSVKGGGVVVSGCMFVIRNGGRYMYNIPVPVCVNHSFHGRRQLTLYSNTVQKKLCEYLQNSR